MKPFTAQEFLNAPPMERVYWCKAMAAEAAKLSAASQSKPLRTAYRELSKQLTTVAEEVMREIVRCRAIARELRANVH